MIYRIKKTGRDITRAELDEMDYAGISEEDIADSLGISRQGLWKIRDKMGWPVRNRSDKGKRGSRVSLDDQRERRCAYMREYNVVNDIKYKNIRVGGVVVSEHRYKASRALGRDLRRGEVVHHRDGDRLNNCSGNLIVCSQAYHLELHRKMQIQAINNV